jgi:hypothetical protein
VDADLQRAFVDDAVPRARRAGSRHQLAVIALAGPCDPSLILPVGPLTHERGPGARSRPRRSGRRTERAGPCDCLAERGRRSRASPRAPRRVDIVPTIATDSSARAATPFAGCFALVTARLTRARAYSYFRAGFSSR